MGEQGKGQHSVRRRFAREDSNDYKQHITQGRESITQKHLSS